VELSRTREGVGPTNWGPARARKRPLSIKLTPCGRTRVPARRTPSSRHCILDTQ
jgi:hypothetical protein